MIKIVSIRIILKYVLSSMQVNCLNYKFHDYPFQEINIFFDKLQWFVTIQIIKKNKGVYILCSATQTNCYKTSCTTTACRCRVENAQSINLRPEGGRQGGGRNAVHIIHPQHPVVQYFVKDLFRDNISCRVSGRRRRRMKCPNLVTFILSSAILQVRPFLFRVVSSFNRK